MQRELQTSLKIIQREREKKTTNNWIDSKRCGDGMAETELSGKSKEEKEEQSSKTKVVFNEFSSKLSFDLNEKKTNRKLYVHILTVWMDMM